MGPRTVASDAHERPLVQADHFDRSDTITNFFMISDRVMNLVDLILLYARGQCVSNYHITLQTQVTEVSDLQRIGRLRFLSQGLVHCISHHSAHQEVPAGRTTLNFEHFTK
jgi:hypothetical protein